MTPRITATNNLTTRSAIRMLRLIRLFRGLRTFQTVAVILDGLSVGLESVGSILVILMVVLYMFSVAGVILFGSIHMSARVRMRTRTNRTHNARARTHTRTKHTTHARAHTHTDAHVLTRTRRQK